MITLQSGTHIIDVQPVDITVRNHDKMKAWREKLAARSRVSEASTRLMIKLMADVPELAELVTVSGDFNRTTLTNLAKNFDDDEEQAKADIQKRLFALAGDSPDIAKALFFPDVDFPSDAESIAIAIECMRDTVDVQELTKPQLKLITSEYSSDFWQDVKVKGVQQYANYFCNGCK